MIRKNYTFAAFSFWLLPAVSLAEMPVSVFKDANCGCCVSWIEHLEEHKYSVKSENLGSFELSEYKTNQSVPVHLRSCHTAEVGGYVIEGHVPSKDIDRLLTEKPDAVGLTVPGMPTGSPGMEFGDRVDAYDVLLIKADGSTEIFASYEAQ